MTREEKVMRVLSEAMQDQGIVPNTFLPVRLGDDTNEVQRNSMVITVADAAEHETLDKVWEMSGVLRLYIKEAEAVRDEVRRGWMTEIQEWLDEADILTQVNAIDECVKFFRLEAEGSVEWSESGRAIWGEVTWNGIVNVE
jgi:hypothetical protein